MRWSKNDFTHLWDGVNIFVSKLWKSVTKDRRSNMLSQFLINQLKDVLPKSKNPDVIKKQMRRDVIVLQIILNFFFKKNKHKKIF